MPTDAAEYAALLHDAIILGFVGAFILGLFQRLRG
jgi:hypothetical protein